jgi:peptidoglycan/LPS O-acetylase OafA/YrhL
MGSLRFLLAISVAYGHAGDFLGFPLVPGDTAVQCFYAISGFYMSLVLNEKYRPESSSYFLFISNRFLRLFPAYGVVLLLTLLLAFVVRGLSPSPDLPFVVAWHSLNPLDWPSAAFLIGSQVIMWGQDLYLFLTLKHGALVFWPDFHTAPQPLYSLLVIPPGWTLGLEFSFYLIAPFIVRRSVAAITAIFGASVALRLCLQFWFGYQGDPWSYRFFPSEVAVFLIGALAYRVYRLPTIAFNWRSCRVFAIAIVCIAIALLINRWNGVSRLASVTFWALAVGAIPFLFRATKNTTIDRYLGELSYPIYICHFLVIWFLDATVMFGSNLARGSSIIAMTLIVSTALYWIVDRPVDVWRHWRFSARKPATLESAKQYQSSRVAEGASSR